LPYPYAADAGAWASYGAAYAASWWRYASWCCSA